MNAAEPVVRELLQRDTWLADLEVTNAGLEEAFLALTQNHNADSKEKTNMAATTFPAVLAEPQRSWSRTLAIYAKEAKYELINKTRIPIYAISTIVFPLMFYVLFGIVLGSARTAPANATYMLATMGCFGVMAVALFGFGVSLAMERGQGWLQVKRASPMPVSAYLPGQAVFRDGIQHRHHAVAAHRGNYLWQDCVCRWQRPPSWLGSWSQAPFRSARWVWRSAISPSRTPPQPSST